MSDTASQRAMLDVENVAAAIAREDGYVWDGMLAQEHRYRERILSYRAMAVAAIDALGLTEEWRTTGWLGPVSESLARNQAQTNGSLQRRLVTTWAAVQGGEPQ